ncbi:Putative two component transcriptional regulator [Magnetospirillum sp. XM-1]|uniref:response regulator transcription factor n=1 Tax=Magnetospirillum sp. XM-1 TaxID=1663591 RepID=UPI00073DBA24|nr:response regulator transcription factor [Magnetospirillum sp. XM-1]CUW41071.1 Putative two component transcriptional regulator [Magnetospirillum sp. XM-1]
MANIIIVADQPDQPESVARYLGLIGMNVLHARSVAELDRLLSSVPVDLVILDIDRADEDAVSLVARLRPRTGAGIVILMAHDDLEEKILGLKAGADTCLVKPVPFREFEAVIRSLLRRLKQGRAGGAPAASDQNLPRWELATLDWLLTAPNGRKVMLSSAEFRVIGTLSANPKNSASRAELAVALGKKGDVYDDNAISTIITRLRRKVKQKAGEPLPIRSARGLGYVFAAPLSSRQSAA